MRQQRMAGRCGQAGNSLKLIFKPGLPYSDLSVVWRAGILCGSLTTERLSEEGKGSAAFAGDAVEPVWDLIGPVCDFFRTFSGLDWDLVWIAFGGDVFE
jgi:hypothetical protein